MRPSGGQSFSRRAPRSGMAGASGLRLSAAEFERAKLSYLETITQELQEAAGLMGQLDRNLSAWARRAGQPEALAQVWQRFQAQLAAVCTPPGTPPASPPRPRPTTGGRPEPPPPPPAINAARSGPASRWFLLAPPGARLGNNP
ncbi:protein diaphanous-like [Gopherus evgoodei]|uniref:protein diaphanous-like n=1 Tax=Gopherus evgoodei TaxID=1825980 RepID=UPI0011CF37F8|nr:protein diaphanous-like [Gopherus evgoodei]